VSAVAATQVGRDPEPTPVTVTGPPQPPRPPQPPQPEPAQQDLFGLQLPPQLQPQHQPGPDTPASRRTASWRAPAWIAAAVVVIALAGVGLGLLLTSGGPLSLLDLDRPGRPVVTGTPGLTPGGPGLAIVFLVSHPPAADVAVTAVEPDAASLPLDCGPQSWSLTPVAGARVPAGTSGTRVAVTVTLTDDAAAACQGITVPAMTGGLTGTGPDGTPARLPATAEGALTVATLGTPGVAVAERSGQTVVLTTPDPAAPERTHYTVEATGADGHWAPLCRLTGPVACAAGSRAGERGVQYRVTARLGGFWRRTSTAITP
jgi:hypothetical protein